MFYKDQATSASFRQVVSYTLQYLKFYYLLTYFLLINWEIMQVCYLIEHLLSSLELPTCDNGELNYLAPGEAYASLIIIQISIVECHLGLESHHNHTPLAHWITINLSIHHRRCCLAHQDCLLNEELGCAFAPFLTNIFFGMSCSAVCHVFIVLHHRIRKKLYASVPKIDWSCQGSRLPTYHSTASGGAHAS